MGNAFTAKHAVLVECNTIKSLGSLQLAVSGRGIDQRAGLTPARCGLTISAVWENNRLVHMDQDLIRLMRISCAARGFEEGLVSWVSF